ncbi:hypothetical protein [Xanthomonas virus PB119]|nr:hypothetical protein [Xanthomonas virus PB119]
MSELNIFERASKEALRFATPVGELTTEQLWKLPLTSTRGSNLNDIAVSVNRDLKAQGEESFVDSKPNPKVSLLTLKLDVLKHIIAVKQAENAAAASERARKEQIAKIEEALTSKQDDALKGMTAEQLEAKLKELRS